MNKALRIQTKEIPFKKTEPKIEKEKQQVEEKVVTGPKISETKVTQNEVITYKTDNKKFVFLPILKEPKQYSVGIRWTNENTKDISFVFIYENKKEFLYIGIIKKRTKHFTGCYSSYLGSYDIFESIDKEKRIIYGEKYVYFLEYGQYILKNKWTSKTQIEDVLGQADFLPQLKAIEFQ